MVENTTPINLRHLAFTTYSKWPLMTGRGGGEETQKIARGACRPPVSKRKDCLFGRRLRYMCEVRHSTHIGFLRTGATSELRHDGIDRSIVLVYRKLYELVPADGNRSFPGARNY